MRPTNKVPAGRPISVCDLTRVTNTPRVDCAPMKALVADDSPTSRALIASYLLREGFDVIEARDGSEAAEVLRAERIDVVFSDVLMPGMNGFTLSRETPRLARRRVPFVAYSGQDWAWVEHDEVRAHVDAFLHLPVTGDKVRAALKEALAKVAA